MTEQRIGLGVDVHPFVVDPDDITVDRDPRRQLVLGGVVVPDVTPLAGHSDADVVAHAIADALLGAAGLGDLGMHFPDTDPRWHGADSLGILAECRARIAVGGWALVNVDCTVITERPKIAPIREDMMARLTAAAGGPVHVKATRPEGLGSLGRVEGIACLAIALLGR